MNLKRGKSFSVRKSGFSLVPTRPAAKGLFRLHIKSKRSVCKICRTNREIRFLFSVKYCNVNSSFCDLVQNGQRCSIFQGQNGLRRLLDKLMDNGAKDHWNQLCWNPDRKPAIFFLTIVL